MFASLKSLTPGQLARKVPRAVGRRVRRGSERVLDRVMSTREVGSEMGNLRRFLPDLSDYVPETQVEALAGVTRNYLRGEFCVLGTGWLAWSYGSQPPGREGHRYDPGPTVAADPEGDWIEGRVTTKNLPESRKLWKLVQGPYQPVDWQLDARSGMRWSAAVHSLDTPIGRHKGSDVKIPWEISKMQHLPRLALAHGLALRGVPGFVLASEYQRAYRNQVIDFLALNPPRFGANWATAMLSGIRVANMVVAHDLFRASGARFDPEFEDVLVRSVQEHISHILSHLDIWDLNRRNNHYLANVAGLAFGAAYLPESVYADTVLAFAARELANEIDYQFNPDGSHFEGSTAYHAFSLDMAAWSRAILEAAYEPSAPVRPSLLPREARRRAFGDGKETASVADSKSDLTPSLHFLRDSFRPGGRLVQVGDNDSGRFLKLDVLATQSELSVIRRRFLNLRELPDHPGPYWDEHELDYASVDGVAAAVVGLAPDRNTVSFAAAKALVGTPPNRDPRAARPVPPPRHSVAQTQKELFAQRGVRTQTQDFRPAELRGDLRDNLEYVVYPDFGLVIFRSPLLWLGIRVGGHHRADGGHAHHDTLAFELYLDGCAWRVDPGAYVYTSLPWRRNQFRSASAHSIPRLREEQHVDDSTDVFAPGKQETGTLLALDRDGLVGRRNTHLGPVERIFRIHADRVEILDVSCSGQPIHVEPLPWWSPGYGRLVAFEAGVRLEGSWMATRQRVSIRAGTQRTDQAAEDRAETQRTDRTAEDRPETQRTDRTAEDRPEAAPRHRSGTTDHDRPGLAPAPNRGGAETPSRRDVPIKPGQPST